MEERSLLKLCLMGSLLGMALMFVASRLVKPIEVSISEVHEGMNLVSITGKVTSIYVSKGGTTFLTLDDGTSSIKAVAFRGVRVGEVEEGDLVRIIGRIQLYRGELEIIAHELSVIR
jgi:RecJ-like exonuclease